MRGTRPTKYLPFCGTTTDENHRFRQEEAAIFPGMNNIDYYSGGKLLGAGED
jgi:hypothetical protein